MPDPILSDTDPDAPALAERRLSFGCAATEYAAARPGYPDEAVRSILAGAAHDDADAAEVGAGTGALTRTLVQLVGRVTAYEPDEGMIAQLERRVPSARAVVASAESLLATTVTGCATMLS